MFKQAEKIVEKFGGRVATSKAIGRDQSSVCRWFYATDKGGTGGLVPATAIPAVLEAAEFLGVELTAEDWAPL